MNLTLLTPLALAAAALAAVPVLLHLIDQRKVPVQDFPALRFLLIAQKKLKRHRRVRDRYLLAGRLLALLALVLAASAPVFSYQATLPAGAELAPNVVFLLDRSMSMGYRVEGEETLFNLAQKRLSQVIQRLPEGTRVGLVTFDRWPDDKVGGVTPDLRRVDRLAGQVEPGYGETDLRAAVVAGVRTLLATPEGGGDLYLLTDLTAASLSGEMTLDLPAELPGKIRLVVPQLHKGNHPNRTVVGSRVELSTGQGALPRVTGLIHASGVGSGGEVPLDLSLGPEVTSRGFVTLTDDTTAEKVFTLPAEADLRGVGSLSLGDDALPADNTLWFRVNQRRTLKALVVDGDPGVNLADGESYFVERALSPRAGGGSHISPVVVGEGVLPRLDPAEFAVVFLLNVAEPGPLAPSLQAYVEAGGALFISVGDHVAPERYNRALRDLLPAALGDTIAAAPDVTGEKPPSLTYPPVNHPVFQVFREAGAAVFGTTSFYRVMPTAPLLRDGGEVLLKFTTGLPALLSRTVGRGRVFLFTSTLDRSWTDFPLKSIFLPFIQESVHYLAENPVSEGAGADLRVGQVVPLDVPVGTGSLFVKCPSGERVPVDPPTESPRDGDRMLRLLFRNTLQPGAYEVTERVEEGGSEELRPDLNFAVNVSELESDLTPLSPEQLKVRLPGVPVLLEGMGEGTDTTVVVDRTRKLDEWLLWGVLLFLLVEGIFLARPRSLSAEEAESAPTPSN